MVMVMCIFDFLNVLVPNNLTLWIVFMIMCITYNLSWHLKYQKHASFLCRNGLYATSGGTEHTDNWHVNIVLYRPSLLVIKLSLKCNWDYTLMLPPPHLKTFTYSSGERNPSLFLSAASKAENYFFHQSLNFPPLFSCFFFYFIIFIFFMLLLFKNLLLPSHRYL